MIAQFNKNLLEKQNSQRSENNSLYQLPIMKKSFKLSKKIFEKGKQAGNFHSLKMIQETLENLLEISKLQLQIQTTGNLWLFTKFHQLMQDTQQEVSQLICKNEQQVASKEELEVDIKIENELDTQAQQMKSETFNFLKIVLKQTQRHLLFLDQNVNKNKQIYEQFQIMYRGDVLVQCYSDIEQLFQAYFQFKELPTVVVLNNVDIFDSQFEDYLKSMQIEYEDFCCILYRNADLTNNKLHSQSQEEKFWEEEFNQMVKERHQKFQQRFRNQKQNENMVEEIPPNNEKLNMVKCNNESNLLKMIDRLLYFRKPFQFILHHDLKLCLPNYEDIFNYSQPMTHASFLAQNPIGKYENEKWIQNIFNLITAKKLPIEIDLKGLSFIFNQLKEAFLPSYSSTSPVQDIMTKVLQIGWNPQYFKTKAVMNFLNSSLCCLDSDLNNLLIDLYQIFIYAFYLYDDSSFALQQIDGNPLYLYKEMIVTEEELEEFLFKVEQKIVFPSFEYFYAELKDAELQIPPITNSNYQLQRVIIRYKYQQSLYQQNVFRPKSTYQFTKKNIYQTMPFSTFEIDSVEETQHGYYIINAK